MATQPPALYLAFLHLIFFLLFVPAWGSLLHGSLLQGVLPLPSPHLLRGQGTGSVSSATLQPAPSPGDTPSTGAATRKVPASEQTAPPGPSRPGEPSADSPEQRKQSRHRREAMLRAPVPQREDQEQGEQSTRTAGHGYLLVLLLAQRERELQLPFFVCAGKWRKWLLATEEIG